jgi:hypothetical protein
MTDLMRGKKRAVLSGGRKNWDISMPSASYSSNANNISAPLQLGERYRGKRDKAQ